MTAITYFGEMLVASVLAIMLLAISPLETRYAGALFAGGAVACHSRRFERRPITSGLPPTPDILSARRHVSKVPFPDSCTAATKVYSITSSVWASGAELYGQSSTLTA
jgi:hypothetical protein